MEDQLEKLKSPLGEIIVMVDGHPIDYITKKDLTMMSYGQMLEIDIKLRLDMFLMATSIVYHAFFCRLAHMKKALRVVND